MPNCLALRSYEEYVPLKKRRQMEEAERLARLGRAPAPTSSADTGGGRSGGGTDSEAEVDHRHKESLLVLKAKQLQEVRCVDGWFVGLGEWLWCVRCSQLAGGRGAPLVCCLAAPGCCPHKAPLAIFAIS